MRQKNLSQLPGFHANDNRIFGGIDRQFTENLLLGIGGEHTHTSFRWNSLNGRATVNMYLHQNRFTENGANSINLRMKKYNQQFLKTELGSAITRSWNLCGGTLTPVVTLGIKTLSKLSGNHLKASLSSLSGSFSALTSNRTILQFATGFDVGYTINNQVTIFASFSGEYARKQQTQRFSGGVNWSF